MDGERVAEAQAAALPFGAAAGVEHDVARAQVVDPCVDDRPRAASTADARGRRGVPAHGPGRQPAPRSRWAKRLRNFATLGATTAAQ